MITSDYFPIPSLPGCLRALNLRHTGLSAKNTSAATQTPISVIRAAEATGNDRPTPLASATYAAKHTGHFGISTSSTLGTTHPASPAARDRGTFMCLQHGRRSRFMAVFYLQPQQLSFADSYLS